MSSWYDTVVNFGISIISSHASRVVHVANASANEVRVIVKDERADAAETDVYLRRGSVTRHRSTGWTNNSHFAVRVRVQFGHGEKLREQSVMTHNNRSVIITASGSLTDAKYQTWWQGGDSSVWRDSYDRCHNPNCPKKREPGCKC